MPRQDDREYAAHVTERSCAVVNEAAPFERDDLAAVWAHWGGSSPSVPIEGCRNFFFGGGAPSLAASWDDWCRCEPRALHRLRLIGSIRWCDARLPLRDLDCPFVCRALFLWLSFVARGLRR